MKKFLNFSTLTQYLIYAVVLYLVVVRIPGWLELYKMKGSTASVFSVQDVKGENQMLPIPGRKQIFVFWATWCGPCSFELNRLNQAISEKKIDGKNIYAISLGEEPGLVSETAKQRGYAMNVMADPGAASGSIYKVSGTPTTVFVNESGIVAWISTGVSPTLVARAEEFLK